MSVVLFRAHEDTAFNRAALARLRAELPGQEVVVVAYVKHAPKAEGIFEDAFVVTEEDVRRLPYPVKLAGFNPDNTEGYSEIPVMAFYRCFPDHDHYWIVEFDVHYAGRWSTLFDELNSSRADFLGTTIRSRAEDPGWCHWRSVAYDDSDLPPEYWIRSFIPFGRVSGLALSAIDAFYTRGLRGHYEAAWPMSCAMAGLTIEDIGGDGPFTPERWKGRHYVNTPLSPYLSPGSFVFRPIFRQADLDPEATGYLWHPVKS